MPIDIVRVTPGAYVGDVVLKAGVTPFLQAAKDKGCTIQVGSDMLFELIPAYLESFGLGVATPDELRAIAHLPWPMNETPVARAQAGCAYRAGRHRRGRLGPPDRRGCRGRREPPPRSRRQ